MVFIPHSGNGAARFAGAARWPGGCLARSGGSLHGVSSSVLECYPLRLSSTNLPTKIILNQSPQPISLLKLSLSLYIYIYIYICMCIYIYIYIYIHIYLRLSLPWFLDSKLPGNSLGTWEFVVSIIIIIIITIIMFIITTNVTNLLLLLSLLLYLIYVTIYYYCY